MPKQMIPPAVAVLCGAVGFGLRYWQRLTGFEPDTGLAVPGAPAALALLLCSLLTAAALLLTGRMYAEEAACSPRNSTAYMTMIVLCAFALFAAAALLAFSFLQGRNMLFSRLILAALCVLSGACILPGGRKRYRGEALPRYDFTLLAPAYACCAWLIAAYQGHAGDPVRQNYIYELLAIIAVLLGLYFRAGLTFDRGRPLLARFFALLGVYFSIVTLADGHDLPTTILFCFSILYLLTITLTRPENAAPEQDHKTEGTSHGV